MFLYNEQNSLKKKAQGERKFKKYWDSVNDNGKCWNRNLNVHLGQQREIEKGQEKTKGFQTVRELVCSVH